MHHVARLLRLGPLLAVALGLTFALTQVHHHASAAPAAAPPEDVTRTFLRDCATCHAADLSGTDDGPDLRGASPALVDYELTTGRMPLPSPDAEVVRRTPRYDPVMIDQLVDHIRSLNGVAEPAVPDGALVDADLAQGGVGFRQACAACHQAAGQGGALRYGEAPALAHSTPAQVIEAARTGPGTMPAFGDDAFTDQQLRDVARYVQYLQDPIDRGGNPLWHFGPLAEGFVAFIAVVGLAGALAVIGERR